MHSYQTLLIFSLLAAASHIVESEAERRQSSCAISSLDDVDSATDCTTITINSFSVPAGRTFNPDLNDETTGDVTFDEQNWDGPLFMISGHDITFNGNGHTFDGNGPFYWDGEGLNGGVMKPDPMMHIEISGTWSNVVVLNSPARAYSVPNTATLTMSELTVDNSAGDAPNSKSGGIAAGHNTDGFDVSKGDITIMNSIIMNQDDCLAIGGGSNIVFSGNSCSGGHGISVGSIDSEVTVSTVTISNNKITNSMQALRIKTEASASGSSVSGVTYSGNTATGCTDFGIIIDQPDTLGTSGNGVKISDITFTGINTIEVGSDADRVAVNCGVGTRSGTWDWSGLTVTGGSAGPVNFDGITGFSQ